MRVKRACAQMRVRGACLANACQRSMHARMRWNARMRPASSRRTPAQQHAHESLFSPAPRFHPQSFPFPSAFCPLHLAHQSGSANGRALAGWDFRHYSVYGNGPTPCGADDALLLRPARSGRVQEGKHVTTLTNHRPHIWYLFKVKSIVGNLFSVPLHT